MKIHLRDVLNSGMKFHVQLINVSELPKYVSPMYQKSDKPISGQVDSWHLLKIFASHKQGTHT
jgi:hypothetical protein